MRLAFRESGQKRANTHSLTFLEHGRSMGVPEGDFFSAAQSRSLISLLRPAPRSPPYESCHCVLRLLTDCDWGWIARVHAKKVITHAGIMHIDFHFSIRAPPVLKCERRRRLQIWKRLITIRRHCRPFQFTHYDEQCHKILLILPSLSLFRAKNCSVQKLKIFRKSITLVCNTERQFLVSIALK